MQATASVSDQTQRAFEAIRFCLQQLFPETETELHVCNFVGNGAIIVIGTTQEGYEQRYERIQPLMTFRDYLRDEEGVAFGFDVQVTQAA
ncbi:MAG: hypothetical protein WD187_03450 [Candidatus Woykebacteria bacterium]